MKTYNIPIFVPHRGCPFDCVFCNQNRITGTQKDVTPEDVKRIIDKHLMTMPKSARRVEAAFFGGSFTGIPISEQNALLSAAYEYINSGAIDGIRISTRPDYIDYPILDNLLKFGVTTIELGVQSMDDEVLILSGRGHTSGDVAEAVEKIKEYPFTLGLQMMTGLPGDTYEKSIYTAKAIIKLRPQIVRIYPTLTIEGTELLNMYNAGTYKPQTVQEAVKLSKDLLLMFEAAEIKVIRIGLQATGEICESGNVVAGPVHSAFGELVENAIYYDLILDAVGDRKDCAMTLYVGDGELSKAIGNKKINIIKLKKERNINLTVKCDSKIKKREVRVSCY